MRVMLRRERRRRNIMEFQGYSLSLPHNTLVERGALLNHTAHYSDHRILVTRDSYLASGIRHSPVPLCLCRIYADIDEALAAVQQIQPLYLIVDLEGWEMPVLALLDHLRSLQRRYPAVEMVLITPELDPVTQQFLQSALRCRLIEKRLALPLAREALQRTVEALPAQVRLFKPKEWSVLMLMAQGHSLSHIARLQIRPYHRIVYRVGCILSLLQLNHRQQLLRVLQRVSALHDRHHSG